MMTSLFPHNVSSVDRLLRAVLGLALLAIAVVGPKTPWGYLGAVPLLTAILGSCPFYTLLGISTCRPALSGKSF